MKKILKCLLLCVVLFSLSACSGGGYNSEKCAQLMDKIEKKEQFSESDYNEMIGQLGALCETLQQKDKELGDDKAKALEFASSEEGKNLFTYTLGFAMFLEQNKQELSPSNVKKLAELEKKIKDLD